MVTTPDLPLKFRRKGCPDFYILNSPEQEQEQDSDIDMPYSSPLSTSYSTLSDFDHYVPRSPTFCSSSSSAAPSSPIRVLFTPEPPSSPVAEPRIASSPKSFWEVAINYGPDLPYKIKGRPAEKPYSSQHRNRMGTRTLSRTTTEQLPPRGASEDTDDGDVDVASVLLDLKRRVRVCPILPELPKRSESESVSPPEETSPPAPPAIDDATGALHSESDAEGKMEIDGAHEKPEERAAFSAIDTNQPVLNVPTTLLDPCVSQTQTSELVAATVEAAISTEHALSLSPLISQENGTRIDESASTGVSVVDAEPIADVGPVDTAVNHLCPILEPLDAQSAPDLALPIKVDHATPALSDLTEFSSQVLSPLSSPVFPSSSRPGSPISEPLSLSPISYTAERCEDDGQVREPALSGRYESCEQAVSISSLPPCETPQAGPSKPRATSTEARNVPSKRKHEDENPAHDTGSASVELATVAPLKEKRKRQRKPKHDESSPSGDDALPADAAKPRKRQPKKQRASSLETPELASSIGAASDHDRESSSQASSSASNGRADTKRPSNVQKKSVPPVREEVTVDPIEHAELSGLLVQAMALSRASSMPASSLHRELLRENPHLTERREKHLWIALIESVLASHPYFGRIERKGLDADDKPLEAQWFYIPEKDVDQERAMLLREMMPKKRSATKTHKQYFYKPLGKITRWDPEDAL